MENHTSSVRYLRQKLAEWGVPVLQAQPGHTLELGEGVYLRVLSRGEWGVTLLLEWGDFRALLPCGLDYDALQDLQADPSITPVSVLLLADRGRDWLNPPEWIDKLHPQVVLLNVAAGDWDGFPPPQTLEALQGYKLLRTDQNGWIQLSTDGHQMWVEAER